MNNNIANGKAKEKNDITLAWSVKTAGHGCFIFQNKYEQKSVTAHKTLSYRVSNVIEAGNTDRSSVITITLWFKIWHVLGPIVSIHDDRSHVLSIMKVTSNNIKLKTP